MTALQAALDGAAADNATRVIVIAAEGAVFSSGHDLKELARHRADGDKGREAYAALFTQCSAMMQAIVRNPKPVIAQVQGVATAAGCKQGVDIAYDGTWGHHPLIVSLANTGEVLSLVNRPGNRPSHEGAAEQQPFRRCGEGEPHQEDAKRNRTNEASEQERDGSRRLMALARRPSTRGARVRRRPRSRCRDRPPRFIAAPITGYGSRPDARVEWVALPTGRATG